MAAFAENMQKNQEAYTRFYFRDVYFFAKRIGTIYHSSDSESIKIVRRNF
jgi:hypothetical protein